MSPGAPPFPLIASRRGDELDFGYSAPAGPEGAVSVRRNRPDRFLHFVGRARAGGLPGARPPSAGGRRGLLAAATRDGSFGSGRYFDSHVRFGWRERGTAYVATLHTFGERDTGRLLDRLLRELRPAAALRRAAPASGAAVSVPAGTSAMAASRDRLWVATRRDSYLRAASLLMIDPSTRSVRPVRGVGRSEVRVAVGPAGVWATGITTARRGRTLGPARRGEPRTVERPRRAARRDSGGSSAASWRSADRASG